MNRFVAGESVPQAVATAGEIRRAGMSVTVVQLGEDVTDLSGTQRIRDGYLALLDALPEDRLAAGADVSVKLSAL